MVLKTNSHECIVLSVHSSLYVLTELLIIPSNVNELLETFIKIFGIFGNDYQSLYLYLFYSLVIVHIIM